MDKSVNLKEPCAECSAPEECWNYGKEPDPDKPEGPWKIVGWFECYRLQSSSGDNNGND